MSISKEILSELTDLVGQEHVITESTVLSEYETATFATQQKTPLVILPGSVEEIQKILEISNRYRIPVYPISRGRNWGLGSRVPVTSGNCIVDLKRLNRIIEFNEELSYITVEPGVTFQQVHEFLQEQGTGLYLAMIGGPTDSSVVANAIERGDGGGPMGDRARFCCGIEAILPTGEKINCGFESFTKSLVGKLSAFGLGPSIEHLFFQSNLAIITKMTFWLPRRPSHFTCMVFGIRGREDLERVSVVIRDLHQLGVVHNTTFFLWNIYRIMANQMRYPWDEKGNPLSSPKELLEHAPRAWKGVRWVGCIGLYSATSAQARIEKRIIKRALKGSVSKLIVLDSFTARIIRALRIPIKRFTNMDVDEILRSLYSESIYLGFPRRSNSSSMYWRKRGPMPSDFNPDRDRCGLCWICPSVPFDSRHIERVERLVEEVFFQYDLEPQLMFFAINERLLKSFIVIAYDRDHEEEEERAKICYETVLSRLVKNGYLPNRLGIQSMHSVAPDQQSYIDVIQRLKKLFDPNDILAPGRYDFRHRWQG